MCKLLNCPICNGGAKLFSGKKSVINSPYYPIYYAYIECVECRFGSTNFCCEDAEEKVIEEWNARYYLKIIDERIKLEESNIGGAEPGSYHSCKQMEILRVLNLLRDELE
jgi:hypothetical protein